MVQQLTQKERTLLQSIWNLLSGKSERTIWDIEISELPTLPAWGLRLARIGALIVRKFRQDELPVRATVLTLTTLMSLAPLLVIGYALLKGLGFGPELLNRLVGLTAEMPEEFQGIVKQVVAAVEATDFSKLGGLGAMILFVMVVQTLGTIEKAFNRVWGVPQNRPFMQKITHYVSIVVIVPVTIATALTVSAQVNMDMLEQSGLVRLVPGFVTWLALTFLYLYMPNTRVRPLPAMAAAALITIAWFVWFRTYITLQPGVTRLNVLYGTLASVPIFLAWLYVGWTIVLMGAVLTFAFQTHRTFEESRRSTRLAPRAQFHLAVDLLLWCDRAFQAQSAPLNAEVYVQDTSAPLADTREVLNRMIQAGWVAEVSQNARDDSVVLVTDLKHIPLEAVLAQIAGSIPDDMQLAAEDQFKSELDRLLSVGIKNLTMADLRSWQPAPQPTLLEASS
ncbi:MAG: YihY/virulence factor BrkB family protein [Acidobacteria bacterium]|nr:YihY/virulence factor BrkB family protein [Acidobacteriota bacterium]